MKLEERADPDISPLQPLIQIHTSQKQDSSPHERETFLTKKTTMTGNHKDPLDWKAKNHHRWSNETQATRSGGAHNQSGGESDRKSPERRGEPDKTKQLNKHLS